MNSYKFQPDHETTVFINADGGITISQADSHGNLDFVAFASRHRSLDVATALVALANLAPFKPEAESE